MDALISAAGRGAKIRLVIDAYSFILSERDKPGPLLLHGHIDPQRLAELFQIDHIATRLRRNGENLQVLAGGRPVRRDVGPVATVELLRAATSEVKDYQRITLGNAPRGSVQAEAAADVVHILAELLENATRFSPPEEKVVLTADRGSDGGLLVEVVDTGLGMTAADLDAANRRLAAGDSVSPETTRRMGLFVVGRLAAPHGVTIRLRATMSRTGRTGITASVHVPGDLVIADGTPLETTLAQLDHRAPEAISAGTGAHALAINGSSHNGSAPNGASLNGSGLDGTVVNGTAIGTTGTHRIQGTLSHPPENPTPPATLGRVRPVPPPPTPPQRTPIFDQLLSNWFTETPADSAPVPPPPDTLLQAEAQALRAEKAAQPAEPAVKLSSWVTPTDDAWRAAENAVNVPEQTTAVTAAGLPTRNPGAQLAPGAAVPRAAPAPQPADFRDPAAVRNNLARHYSGMRAARQQAGNSPEATGEGKGDPQ